jgi:hypothetical protein
MIGHRAVIGLSLLSVLLLSALAAQSAAAAPAKNTTLYTCAKVGTPKTGDFEDEHCDKTHPKKEGEWTHTVITNAKTFIKATNDRTGTKENSVLKWTVGGW